MRAEVVGPAGPTTGTRMDKFTETMLAKTGLIGQINASNQFDIVWTSGKPIEPDPFLKGYSWWDPSKG